MGKLDQLVFKLCQTMITHPQHFDLKSINNSTHMLCYKAIFVANINGTISLNYKGKDINLNDQQRLQLKEAFEETFKWQKNKILEQIEELLK